MFTSALVLEAICVQDSHCVLCITMCNERGSAEQEMWMQQCRDEDCCATLLNSVRVRTVVQQCKSEE